MVAGFTDLYGVTWPSLTLGGLCNVTPLQDMCYRSFLIKKAAVFEAIDFVSFIKKVTRSLA